MNILKNPIVGVVALAILAILGWNTLFTVDQRQQAIVLQFGELRHVYTEPGLKVKIPFIQEVMFYDRRVLDLDSENPVRITTSDQKRLWVDSYARYRIEDPLVFYRAVKPATEIGARSRLEVLISSAIRNVLGKIPLRSLLSEERANVMHLIQTEVSTLAKSLGIVIVDVRIIRAELPTENRKAVFARMNSDLFRVAKENRAKGYEAAQSIKSGADKDRTIILANADKQAQILHGEGDATAAEIVAKSIGQDPKFYAFDRTMELYESVLADNTTFVLTTDSDLLQFIEQGSFQTK